MAQWLPRVRERVLWIARFAFWISAAGLAAELVILITTALPDAPVVSQWPVFALFPGIFVVHLRSVVMLIKRRSRAAREVLSGVPTPVAWAFLALFLAAWVVGVISITHIRGGPTVIEGRYYLNDHGRLVPVTHSGYLHALVLQQRIFTSIPSVFYALGVIVNWPTRPDKSVRTAAAPRTAGPLQ